VAPVLAALPDGAPVAVFRDGRRWIVAAGPCDVVRAGGADALTALSGLGAGWWAGWLAYELGRTVEPFPAARPATGAAPDVHLVRYGARLVLDPADGSFRLGGDGEGRSLLRRAIEEAGAATALGSVAGADDDRRRAPWATSLGREEFVAGVRRVVELVREGDCYQVNLTRQLTSNEPPDPRALFAALERANPAPHAALLSMPDGTAVVSASPERFLRVDGRAVETRPIKGTHRDRAPLEASAKDRAENVMIVDLARNDLGRVCEPGSVTVPSLCEVERHPGLHHLVSTVRGRLRNGVRFADLVAATFPPASVTGAPKPRVLRRIDELEPVPRGVYCGALGWIDTERDRADLAVAIRTFTVADGRVSLGTGAGITADSDPHAEWDETELKASRLLAAAGVAAPDVAPALSGAPR
jgi:para-aminobenzoate synthetase component 1